MFNFFFEPFGGEFKTSASTQETEKNRFGLGETAARPGDTGRPGSVALKYPVQDCLTACRRHASNPDTGEEIPGCFCRLKTPFSQRKFREDKVHDIGVLYHYGECVPANPGCRGGLEEDSGWSILRTNCPEGYQYCSNWPRTGDTRRCVPRDRDCEKNAQAFSAKHHLEPKKCELEAKGEECIAKPPQRGPHEQILRPSSWDQRTIFQNFKCTTSEDCLNQAWPGGLRRLLRDHREKYGDGDIYRYRCSCKIFNKYRRFADRTDLDKHLKKLAKATVKRRKDEGRKVEAEEANLLYRDLKEGKREHWTETDTYKRLKEDMYDVPRRDRETYIDAWNSIPKFCCPKSSRRAGTCTGIPSLCDKTGRVVI